MKRYFSSTAASRRIWNTSGRRFRRSRTECARTGFFFGLLQKLDLLEPVSIKISLTEEKQIAFNGYHTVNQERLANLDGSSLLELNRAGVLSLVFFMASSLGNFQKLIELKNARSSML